MASDTLTLATRAQIEAIAPTEPRWLLDRRIAALEESASLQLPMSKQTKIGEAAFVQADAPKLPQVTFEGAPQGVILMDLDQAVREHADLLQPYLLQVAERQNLLHAQHAALTKGGFFCYVPKDQELTEPVRATFHFPKDGYYTPHVLLVAGERSRCDLIVELVGVDGGAPAINGGVEVVVSDGAQVQYIEFQRLPGKAQGHWSRRAAVGRDGKLTWILNDVGARLQVADTRTELRGDGSDSRVFATFFGGRRQHFDFRHIAVHVGQHTTSDTEARGVLQGKARAVYNANTIIRPHATGTSGWQHEHTLMLSETARADLVPELEIDEWDVKAGHAASAGPVDPMQLYFMMARGISEIEARRLIVFGFLSSLLDSIPLESVREQIAQIFHEKVEA
ncbi:MAG: Fe-S cluster assembly protein SufD [Thermaerobacter sp.]|nr:Fe-S cluster assembly protein SufD [Thermaerobacter sp.]